MMKKTYVILVIIMMLVTVIPIANVSSSNNKEIKIDSNEELEFKDDINSFNFNLNEDVTGELKDHLSSNIKKSDIKLGFYKIETNGKGFHIAFKTNLIKFNIPLPSPQYPMIFPIWVKIYLCYIKYKDDNATTKITNPFTGEVIFKKNGSHTLLIPLINSNSIKGICNLLRDGVFDGLPYFRWYFPSINYPAKIISKIIKGFGGPFINISDETYYFLKPLWNDSEPLLFDGSGSSLIAISDRIAKFFGKETFPKINEKIIKFRVELFIRMLLWSMWNSLWDILPIDFIRPLGCRFLPMDLSGYTFPFVAWRE